MARTNKTWIMKQKKQAEKQKKKLKSARSLATENTKRMSHSELKDSWLIRTEENPKGNKYERTKIWKKWWCSNTKIREDVDWYRLVKQNWKLIFEYKWNESWAYRKWTKKWRK